MEPNSLYCYKLMKDMMTFEEAVKSCKKENFGELASITSNDLQTAINDERKKNNIQFMWIGLKKDGKFFLLSNYRHNKYFIIF